MLPSSMVNSTINSRTWYSSATPMRFASSFWTTSTLKPYLAGRAAQTPISLLALRTLPRSYLDLISVPIRPFPPERCCPPSPPRIRHVELSHQRFVRSPGASLCLYASPPYTSASMLRRIPGLHLRRLWLRPRRLRLCWCGWIGCRRFHCMRIQTGLLGWRKGLERWVRRGRLSLRR